jgi:hypothetical protein
MARSRAVKSIGRYLRGRPINLEISQMKKLSIIAVAILLGLGGAAMASPTAARTIKTIPIRPVPIPM